jgi:hypothetical protein
MITRASRISLVIAFAAVLAACQPAATATAEATQAAEPAQPPDTPQPTEAPPTEIPPTEAPAANMPAELVGSFKVRLPASVSMQIDAGWYRVEFREDGTYVIAWSTLQDLPGEVGVRGQVAVSGNQIEITDVEGFAACSAEEGPTGLYEWAIVDDQLVLTVVEDTCPGRPYVLSSKPFPKEAP